MALVKTVIDTREAEVERDRWALDVAREMGIEIPTLCHHPALEPYGACRLCVVEVTRGKWTWLTTSCDLPIREGLEIRTDTENVMKARRMALELLWAQAPEAEVVQRMARAMGVRKPRFAVREGLGKCILCGLCVRVCAEVLGESAVSFSKRGASRVVTTPFADSSSECIGCGACIAVCPTGHIVAEYDEAALKLETWKTELELARCEKCGRAYLPRRMIERIERECGETCGEIRLCPKCRSGSTVEKWSDALRLADMAGRRGG